MEDKKNITIHLNNEETYVLENDTPNITGLVEKIVNNRKTIDINNISVCSNSEDFDIDSFKNIIIESTKDFMEKIKVNDEKFNEIIESLKNQKNEIE